MEAIYLHLGEVTQEAKLRFDNPEMWERNRKELIGKRFELRLKEEEYKKSKEQLGYLFRGIIRGECCNSNDFTGWTEKEILHHLECELSTYLQSVRKLDGTEVKKEYILTVKSMGKKQLTIFIEKVIIYLSELGINVKEPKVYG